MKDPIYETADILQSATLAIILTITFIRYLS